MTPNPIPSALIHSVRPPRIPATERAPALILLHGQGGHEDSLLGLAEHLDPRLFIAGVRAPFSYAPQPGGYSWYEVPAPFTPDPRQLEESLGKLQSFILEAVRYYPIDERRLFLFGFSMGSVLSFALSLTLPGMVRGIIAHSGYIPETAPLEFAWNRLQSLSVFIAHGTRDAMIPIRMARRARELLGKTEADLTYREYPVPHRISKQSLRDLSAWLADKLGP